MQEEKTSKEIEMEKKLGFYEKIKLIIANYLISSVFKFNIDNCRSSSIFKKQFGELKASLLYNIINGFDIDIDGIMNLQNGYTYNLPIQIDVNDDDLWNLYSGDFKDAIYIYRKRKGNQLKVYYADAISFYTVQGKNTFLVLKESIDGIDETQEIKLDSKGMAAFTPKTFDIEVVKEGDIYHIKNKRQLTEARKIYNIPYVKRESK